MADLPQHTTKRMTKDELRKRVRELYRASAPADRVRWSGQLCGKLLSDPSVESAATVMAFYPLPDEVDIRPLLDALRAQGKTVVLPQVTGETEMRLRQYEGVEALEREDFDILVPQGYVFDRLDEIDVVIVPGMAFDSFCHRMGRGKGYYDRFLSGLNAVKIGVCFPYQFVAEVPCDGHDVLMDRVITL